MLAIGFEATSFPMFFLCFLHIQIKPPNICLESYQCLRTRAIDTYISKHRSKNKTNHISINIPKPTKGTLVPGRCNDVGRSGGSQQVLQEFRIKEMKRRNGRASSPSTTFDYFLPYPYDMGWNMGPLKSKETT